MSSNDHEKESNNPLASLIGTIFLISVPLSLVVMLGIVGAAFVKGAGYKEAPPEAVSVPGPPASKGSGEPKVGADPVFAKDNGAPTPEQMELGKNSFMTCAACHGMDGKGLQIGPTMKMAPSFEASQLLLGNVEAPLAAVLKGIHKEPGGPYMGQMMALGATLDDEKLAAVLSYIRNSFGNKASAVSAEQSAAARKKYATVDSPTGLPRADLEKIARGE